MRCTDCGQELAEGSRQCLHCNNAPQVTVLSPREREQFQGVTINQDEETGREDYRSHTYEANPRIRVRQIHVSGSSFWSRLLIAVAILAFLGALVFVALPLVLLIIAIVVVVSFFLRILN